MAYQQFNSARSNHANFNKEEKKKLKKVGKQLLVAGIGALIGGGGG